MATERKKQQDRERMQRKRAEDARKVACMDALLSAKDIWEDYGSGFRIHFSFESHSNMNVVEMVHTARAYEAMK